MTPAAPHPAANATMPATRMPPYICAVGVVVPHAMYAYGCEPHGCCAKAKLVPAMEIMPIATMTIAYFVVPRLTIPEIPHGNIYG